MTKVHHTTFLQNLLYEKNVYCKNFKFEKSGLVPFLHSALEITNKNISHASGRFQNGLEYNDQFGRKFSCSPRGYTWDLTVL